MSFIANLLKPNIDKLEQKHDVDGLIKALNYDGKRWEEWAERETNLAAAKALGNLADPRAANPLIVQLISELTRMGIKVALYETGQKSGRFNSYQPAFRPMVSQTLIREILISLGKIGEPAFEPMKEAAKQVYIDYENTKHQTSSNRPTGPTIDQAINNMMKGYELLMIKDWMREEATNALIEVCVRIGHPPAMQMIRDKVYVKDILKILKDNPQDNLCLEHAAFALGEIGDPSAVETLAGLQDHPDAGVKRAVSEALRKLSAPAETAPVEQSETAASHPEGAAPAGPSPLVAGLMSTELATREAALAQVLQKKDRLALQAVEEALLRLTGKESIAFFDGRGILLGSSREKFNEVIDLALDGSLAEKPEYIQSLVPQIGFLNNELMEKLSHIDPTALAIYQLLGVQMQLSILLRA